MSEDPKPNEYSEYQKTMMKVAASRTLSNELRHICSLIEETKVMFSSCDEDFEQSEMAKELDSLSSKTFHIGIKMLELYLNLFNKEANTE